MVDKQILTNNKKDSFIFILLLLGLLILRFPYFILLSLGRIPLPSNMGLKIINSYNYLLIALLIFFKRDSLSDYHIDFYAFLIFIITPLAKCLGQYLVLPFIKQKPEPLIEVLLNSKFELIISICLLIALLIYKPKLHRPTIKKALLWLMIAIAVGIFSSILHGNILKLQGDSRSILHPSFLQTIYLFFMELGKGPVNEEPLFRGFLWGFLKKNHWKDCWIWLFQAGLFMIGHVFYLGVNNYAFISTLLAGLILGLIAWRSRSIGTSMIVHGLINSLGDMIAHFTW